MRSKRIHLGELEPGPIRHADLPPALVARVKDLCLALHEVYPSSLADWLEDFQRDLHPEREIVWWERLTRCYLAYTGNRDLGAEQRQAAFKVLFNVCMSAGPEIFSNDLAALPNGALADLEAILREQGP